MKTLERIAKDLIGLEVEDGNIENDIIEAFEDYEFEGVTSIIVTEDAQGRYNLTAYAEHKEAPQIMIDIENNIIVRADIEY